PVPPRPCTSLHPLLPPPPRSPLFPYTTLFRSRRRRAGHRAERARRPAHRAHERVRQVFHRVVPEQIVVDDFAEAVVDRVRRITKDRESTRLNSSHLGISYAVFCLKKKKKQSTT